MSISDKTPQRAVVHFCFKLGKSPLETLQMINVMCGDTTVNRRHMCRWYQRFRDGDESLEDLQRTGRRVCESSDKNVSLFSDAINEDRGSTVQTLCEDLGMSYATVQTLFNDELNMRRVSARWLPRLLKVE